MGTMHHPNGLLIHEPKNDLVSNRPDAYKHIFLMFWSYKLERPTHQSDHISLVMKVEAPSEVYPHANPMYDSRNRDHLLTASGKVSEFPTSTPPSLQWCSRTSLGVNQVLIGFTFEMSSHSINRPFFVDLRIKRQTYLEFEVRSPRPGLDLNISHHHSYRADRIIFLDTMMTSTKMNPIKPL